MSQGGIIDLTKSDPEIPRTLNADTGSATATDGVINVLGGTNVTTSGSGSTLTINATGVSTPIAVADGGTGRSSHTEYAVLCGGTTTTAAQQSIASVGTSGQVLTSNGAAALPTFQNASGGSYSPGYQSGWYYTPYPIQMAPTGTRSISSSFYYLQLMFFREEVTIDTIAFEVSTAATSGKSLRIGRYGNTDGRPTTLAEEFGTIVVDSTGEKTLGSLSSTIPAGYSWLAFQSEDTVVLRGQTPAPITNQFPSSTLTSRSNTLGALFYYSGSVWASGFIDLSASSVTTTNTIANIQFKIA
jgi:hypothetical protein